MSKWYIGLTINGGTVAFQSMDVLNEFNFLGYFQIDDLPQQEGIMRTDGVSKIWFEKTEKPIDIVEPEKFISDAINQI